MIRSETKKNIKLKNIYCYGCGNSQNTIQASQRSVISISVCSDRFPPPMSKGNYSCDRAVIFEVGLFFCYRYFGPTTLSTTPTTTTISTTTSQQPRHLHHRASHNNHNQLLHNRRHLHEQKENNKSIDPSERVNKIDGWNSTPAPISLRTGKQD